MVEWIICHLIITPLHTEGLFPIPSLTEGNKSHCRVREERGLRVKHHWSVQSQKEEDWLWSFGCSVWVWETRRPIDRLHSVAVESFCKDPSIISFIMMIENKPLLSCDEWDEWFLMKINLSRHKLVCWLASAYYYIIVYCFLDGGFSNAAAAAS